MIHPIKTGLLAYGASGKLFHAPFLHAHPGFQLYSVTERNQKNAVHDYPGIKSFNSIEEQLADPSIELIVINTPNNTHVDFAIQALNAGKHILIEKPCATSVAEAKALFDLGKKVNKQVLVYQNRRWDSDYNSVKEIINSRQLGPLVEVHFRFDRYRLDIGPKIFKEEPIPGSGLLFDLGPHLVDQVIDLFGAPIHCFKKTGIYRPNSKVNDYAFIHLSYPEQLQVYVYASMLVANPQPAFVIHGQKGSFIKYRTDVQEDQLREGILPTDPNYGLEKPGSEGLLTLINKDGETIKEYLQGDRGDYRGIFEAVYQTIRNNQTFPVKEEHILWQMSILENSNQS
jgi:scyllo-inositol 2-dehydrogenase (NADP+)